MSLSKLWLQATIGLGLVLGGLVGPTPAATNGTQRVIIYAGAGATFDQLKSQGITQVDNYGGYWIATVNDSQLANLQKTLGNQVQIASHLNRIELNVAPLNTQELEPQIASALRQKVSSTGKYLWLLQFKGPVLPDWLKAVTAIPGLKIVSYIPNNAYVVSLDVKGEAQLRSLMVPAGPIQWLGAYHPAYKIQKGLVPNSAGTATVEVRVIVVNGPEAAATLATLRQYAVGGSVEPLVQRNHQIVQLTVGSADIAAIAQLPDVLWIERVAARETKDEKADLILSGHISQLPGHSPIPANSGGERYLDFLYRNVGGGLPAFTNSATYPIVDIADTGFELGSTSPAHPDFYEFGDPNRSSRVVYSGAARYPDLASCVPYSIDFADGADFCGHGTFVASIVNGYNDTSSNYVTSCTESFEECVCTGVGSNRVCSTQIVNFNNPLNNTFLDPDGFQLGLGVSPFGLIGTTRIFAQNLGFVCDPYLVTPVCNPEPMCVSSLPVLAAEAYIKRARIANNSWGDVLASDPSGHFLNAGLYTTDCQTYDLAVRDALLTGVSAAGSVPGPSPLNQEFIVVFAGGNAGSGGNVGGFGDVLMTAPATAKNIIAVGATENVRLNGDGCLTTGDQDNSFDISGYSSFGPTLDGRFKPEIVAPGSSVYGANDLLAFSDYITSCAAAGNTEAVTCYPVEGVQQCAALYRCDSGTSFAAPAVSGGIQLLWWYFQNRLNMLPPSPAMAKAYLCNSARYLPITDHLTGAMDTLPSIGQGMGMMDLSRMFDGIPRVLRDESTPRAIDLPLMTTNPAVQQTFFSQSGQAYEVSGQVYDPTQPFRVTVAWTDAPGDPAAFKQLVNDLDLQVTVNGKVYKGNVFSGDHSVVGGGYDDVNNMESVFLPAGQTGTWSVVVRAANIAGNGVPNIVTPNGTNALVGQDFALVIYNAKPNNPAPSDLSSLITNDTCQSAIEIQNFPFVFSNQLNRALYHNTMPSPSAGRGGINEFFKIVVPEAGTTIYADTFGSDFDTLLSVWQVQTLPQTVHMAGNCGALVEVASNNDAPASYTNPCNGTVSGNYFLQAAVSWVADGSNTYYIVAEPFNDNIPVGKGHLTINVCGSVPSIYLIPSTTNNFGHVLVGASSAASSVVLSNGTANPLNVLSVQLAGNNPGDFVILQDQCSEKSIDAQATCSTLVGFSPITNGLRTANLLVTYESYSGPQTKTLLLVGIGDAPQPVICAPASLAFPVTDIGFSTNLSFVVTNCGTLVMQNFSASLSGAGATDYSIVQPICSSITNGGSCTLTIGFAPSTNGTRSASLTIAGTGATSKIIQLTGTGKPPEPFVCVSTGPNLDFGGISLGSNSTQSVVVTNCGTAVLSIGAIGLSGPNSNLFQILPATDGCSSSSIPPGGHCSFLVTYHPIAVGTAAATVTINDNTSVGQYLINVVANCVNTQPDAFISSKLTAKSFVGKGIYNHSGAAQEVKLPVARGKTCVFYVECQNAGTGTDRFTVLGDRSGSGYTVQYFQGTAVRGEDNVDVTRTVTAGSYSTADLGAQQIQGNATLLRVVITADKTAAKGTHSVLLTYTSQSNPLKIDTVKATFTIK